MIWCVPYTLPAFQSRLTRYDVHFPANADPIDLSHGSFDLRFLGIDYGETLWQICEKVGVKPVLGTQYGELPGAEEQAQEK